MLIAEGVAISGAFLRSSLNWDERILRSPCSITNSHHLLEGKESINVLRIYGRSRCEWNFQDQTHKQKSWRASHEQLVMLIILHGL